MVLVKLSRDYGKRAKKQSEHGFGEQDSIGCVTRVTKRTSMGGDWEPKVVEIYQI